MKKTFKKKIFLFHYFTQKIHVLVDLDHVCLLGGRQKWTKKQHYRLIFLPRTRRIQIHHYKKGRWNSLIRKLLSYSDEKKKKNHQHSVNK